VRKRGTSPKGAATVSSFLTSSVRMSYSVSPVRVDKTAWDFGDPGAGAVVEITCPQPVTAESVGAEDAVAEGLPLAVVVGTGESVPGVGRRSTVQPETANANITTKACRDENVRGTPSVT
jgi:hypothetical protein